MEKKALASSLVVGLLVLAAILFFVGPEEALKELSVMEPRYLVVVLLFQFLSLLVVALRWKWFLNATGYKTSSWDIFWISLAGQASNNIMPASRTGGEPVKAYLLYKRDGVPPEAGMASLVVDKISDIAAFSLLSFAAIVYGLLFFNVPAYVMALMILAFLFTLSVLLALFYVSFFKRIPSETVIRLIDRYKDITDKIPFLAGYKNRIEESLNNFYTTILRISSHKYCWEVGVLLSLTFWLIEIGKGYLIFKAFGFEVPLAVLATAHIVSSLIGSIPLLPGGLGFVEGTMILIYSTSVLASVGGIVTIIDRFFSYWLVIILGLPVAWYLGVTSSKNRMNGESYANEDGASQRP